MELFEQNDPGLLSRIAADKSMSAIVTQSDGQFLHSYVRIGDVYVNTHASAAAMQDWSRRIAKLAGVNEGDYGFVLPVPGA